MAANVLDWHGAKAPRREPLAGRLVVLEPLDPQRHGEDLYSSAAGADESWLYLPYGPFATRGEFLEWLGRHASTADPMAFAVVDRAGGDARGIATFMSMVPEHGVIEIGHLWFSPKLQQTRQATETIYVMSKHAFELGHRRLEWKCDAANAPSRRAAERFGFTFEGVFRQHRVVKARNRDTAWYSITDGEWPSRRAAFEAWLDDSNFDAAGRQVRSLTEVRVQAE